jgi:hypothetical protein
VKAASPRFAPTPASGFRVNAALQSVQAKMAPFLNRAATLPPPPPVYRPAAVQRAAAVAQAQPLRAGAVERRPAPPVFAPFGGGRTSVLRKSAPAAALRPLVVQPYFTHSGKELTDDQIDAIYANLEIASKATAKAFWRGSQAKTDKGSVSEWLNENGIYTAVRDLMVVPDSGFHSDVGETTEDEMMGVETQLSSMKKGKNKQQSRTDELISKGKHIHSEKALDLATRIAVAEATSQMTSALARTTSGSEHFQMTTSSAPLQQWIQTNFTEVNLADVGRNTLYPDGSHVHAEMRLLAYLLRQGKGGAGTKIIVSKPCCPVCFDVLAAFGWEVVDPAKPGEYFDKWGNPFKKVEENAWFTKANNAADQHSEECTILKRF